MQDNCKVNLTELDDEVDMGRKLSIIIIDGSYHPLTSRM
jgi:hypothetical protein